MLLPLEAEKRLLEAAFQIIGHPGQAPVRRLTWVTLTAPEVWSWGFERFRRSVESARSPKTRLPGPLRLCDDLLAKARPSLCQQVDIPNGRRIRPI